MADQAVVTNRGDLGSAARPPGKEGRVIGLIGLGTMGARLARRWLEAGYEVVGFDADETTLAAAAGRGVTPARSVVEVADRAETVAVSLPSPEVVRAVAFDGPEPLLDGRAIRTYVDLSTTGPSVAAEVAAALSTRGIQCVDAPVSGGPAGAQGGTLTVMVAGSPEAIVSVRPLLDAIGSKIFVVGAVPGQGQTVKLINNLLSAAAIAITGEALTLGAKSGLDPALILAVVGVSSGANNAAADKFPRQVLTRAFDHGFRLDLMAKDVRLCLAEADRWGVRMDLGSATNDLWQLAAGRLGPGADCTAIVQIFEEWAGTRITSPPEPDRGSSTPP